MEYVTVYFGRDEFGISEFLKALGYALRIFPRAIGKGIGTMYVRSNVGGIGEDYRPRYSLG